MARLENDGAYCEWENRAPEEKRSLGESFNSAYNVPALPHHGPRSRLPNPHPISFEYGFGRHSRPVVTDATLWGRLHRTDESHQLQRDVRSLPREPMSPRNIRREDAFVDRLGGANADLPDHFERFPNRLGSHFDVWMQEQRDAQEQTAKGLTSRRDLRSFDRRMLQEEEHQTGPVLGMMEVPTPQEAAASPRYRGMKKTDVTAMQGARPVPDGLYLATGGRSPDGRAFGWGGREVNRLDVRTEGHRFPPVHIGKPYEPHLQLGEHGFGRSRNLFFDDARGTLAYTQVSRGEELMHRTADAGGYRRAETDVQYPAKVPVLREAPYEDHRINASDLHKETWSREFQIQTGAVRQPNYGRRATKFL